MCSKYFIVEGERISVTCERCGVVCNPPEFDKMAEWERENPNACPVLLCEICLSRVASDA